MKKISIVLILLLLAICVCSCSVNRNSVQNDRYNLEFYNKPGKKVGVVEGTVQEAILERTFPKAEICKYKTVPDLTIALEKGKIDCFSCNDSSLRDIMRTNKTITYIDKTLESFPCAFAFAKTYNGKVLRDEMNVFLKKISDDGTLDKLINKWMIEDSTDKSVDMSGLSTTGKVLRFSTTGSYPPFTFLKDNKLTGLDVDLAVRFCREYGYGIDMDIMDFEGIISSLSSGRYDFAGNTIVITKERAESVYFANSVYAQNILIAIPSTRSEKYQSRFNSLKSSFKKTFIREQRWKLILQGLGITLLLSLFSILFGTLLGFVVYIMRRSSLRILRAIALIHIKIMQGTPILVIIMILFYIVFNGTSLSGVWIAIIGFSLYFSTYVSEIIYSGINSVDIGQSEAALSLGYTKAQTFCSIVLPQAVTKILPVYRGEIISLVKNTSIVGYIAIEDLTKVGDLIRSRTYEAFFPLIVTAIIYFAISMLLVFGLKKIEGRIKPNRRRVLKKMNVRVNINDKN